MHQNVHVWQLSDILDLARSTNNGIMNKASLGSE